MQGILNLALKSREEYNASHPEKAAGRIREICCEYGLLACFEPQTLRACFELFAEGTAAENAALVLKPQALACQCNSCGHKFSLLRKSFICPHCGNGDISFSKANGLILQSIDVDNGEEEK